MEGRSSALTAGYAACQGTSVVLASAVEEAILIQCERWTSWLYGRALLVKNVVDISDFKRNNMEEISNNMGQYGSMSQYVVKGPVQTSHFSWYLSLANANWLV
jgi:hypothetical protein